MQEEQEQAIPCPICRKANPDIEALNRQINQSKDIADKATFAKKLLTKVEDVLAEHGPADGPQGKACRSVLNLRKQTAELILKAQKLAD